MSESLIIIFLLVSIVFLLASGVWVGLALSGTAWLVMEFFSSRSAGEAMAITIWGSSSSWTLTALPLFLWMGEILTKTRLSKDLFSGLAPWLDKIPGRLLHTNVIACAVFAAVSGSSAATCATIGNMSIPQLKERGYPDSMILGTLAGAGTLGLLIPPSIIMIVYGVSANVSISKLFIAGILPGILLASLFMGYIIIWSLLNKDKMPSQTIQMSFIAKVKASRSLIPVIILIAAVLGSIYTGFATATEAAAVGVFAALILALLQGDMNWSLFKQSLISSTCLFCMIALILAGAQFLTLAMGYIGLPRSLAEWITSLNLSPFALIMALMVFFVILGCFLDGISMVVLTMGVLLPTVEASNIDLLWFGIFLIFVIEMAQITPPVGFNLFVLSSMSKRQITYLAKVSAPMFLLMIVGVIILYFFPELATWLPTQMR